MKRSLVIAALVVALLMLVPSQSLAPERAAASYATRGTALPTNTRVPRATPDATVTGDVVEQWSVEIHVDVKVTVRRSKR